MYTGNCSHQTGVGDKESNARKTQASVLEGKTLQCLSSTVYSSDFSNHLLFLCSLNNLGCLISFNTELHESLIYTWVWSPYQICDLQIFFSFHKFSFHFIDGFFYYAEGFEFDVVPLVYFCSSCFCFWWLCCLRCLYFGNQSFINCFISYYLLPFLPKDTDWLNGYKRRPIYMLTTRDPLQF